VSRVLAVAAAAAVAGVLFVGSLSTLWPLVDADLTASPAALERQAREFLSGRGFDLAGYESASVVTVDAEALDWAERAFGRERTQEWIREGLPFVEHQVALKRAGDPHSLAVRIQPNVGVTGWSRRTEEDDPGASVEPAAARGLAVDALSGGLGLTVDSWTERSATVFERPARRDHAFTFERTLSAQPELRERAVVVVAGDRVVQAERRVVVPGPARRAARAAEAPGRALETAGFVVLAIAAAAAFWVFLTRLRAGAVRLERAAALAGIAWLCLVGTWFLQTGSLFAAWEPLWPRWVATFQTLALRAAEQFWMVLVLLALIAAGDSLDRETGAGRGEALWSFLALRWRDREVGRSAVLGWLVGLLAGGALAAAVLALGALAGAPTALQPRGFFFYALNSASPALSTLLFFLNVALLEELGYRFFAGAWLESLGARPWVAIVVPAAIYGLTHTRLDFLPPAEPFWARPLALTAVGCVWGWAFFRFGALAVVLSHWTADLFIFNWPRLASGKPATVAVAVATVLVPLIPVLFSLRSGPTDPRRPPASLPR